MHATAPTPIHRPTTCLTERGHTVVDFYRWLDQLRALDVEDRVAIADLAVRELTGATDPA